MEILFREFLTKLSKAPHSLENRLEKLGTFGTIIQSVIGIIIFAVIYILPILTISYLFPDFYNYGDQRSIDIALVILACIIFSFIHWLFGSKPKDYVASKITNDIYNIIGELNKNLYKTSKLGQKINVKKETYQDYQHFSVHYEERSLKKSEDISDLKSQTFDLIDDLNDQLTKAKERNLQISIDLKYRGSDERKEKGSSQPYRYHFFADIKPI